MGRCRMPDVWVGVLAFVLLASCLACDLVSGLDGLQEIQSANDATSGDTSATESEAGSGSGTDSGRASSGEVVTECQQSVAEAVIGGTYYVQTDEWNSTQPQCLSIEGTSFTVTTANFNLPPNGSPATYPSIYKGCHWGNCTTGSGLPVQVANMPSVTTSWSTTEAAGVHDVAYYVWFNQTPTTTGQPNGAGLMIWISESGAQAAGSMVGTAQVAGATWSIWKSAKPTWTYVAYVRTPATDSVTDLDVRAITEDAVSRGLIKSSWYLIDVEAGFEIWQGGQGLAVNSFSVVVGDGGLTGSSGSDE